MIHVIFQVLNVLTDIVLAVIGFLDHLVFAVDISLLCFCTLVNKRMQ